MTTVNSDRVVDYIYKLYEVESGVVWYIGRTHREPSIRLSEHCYGAKVYKPGDEDKYLYASSLDSLGVRWDLEVIATCDHTTKFFEDYYVNLYRSSPLQNMRGGDSEPWMGRDYTSPREFLDAREQVVAEAKAQAKTAKFNAKKALVASDPEQVLYSFEKPHQRFTAPAFEALAKRVKRH